MKKMLIIFLFAVFITGCAKDSGLDTARDLIEPDSFAAKTVLDTKEYSFSTPAESCGVSTECAAIIFKGTVGDKDYIGIAVNDSHADNDFNLKIYFEDSGSAIPEGNVTKSISEYTIKVRDGNTVYSTPSNILDIDITKDSSSQFTIQFNSAITLTEPGNLTLTATGNIVAQKYPEE